MNIKQKITTATASALILSSVLTSGAMASTTVKVKDNLAGSINKTKVNNSKSSAVIQGNAQVVLTGVTSASTTGGNKAKDNGSDADVKVKSGKAKSKVGVEVSGGVNATTDTCGCEEGDTDVTITGNGKDSVNKVKVNNSSQSLVMQGNMSHVVTNVVSVADTGNNTANDNLGGSNVDVTSGNAKSNVQVTVGGGTNVVNP